VTLAFRHYLRPLNTFVWGTLQPNSGLCGLKEVNVVIRRATWSASGTRAKSDAEYASLMRPGKNAYKIFLGNRANLKAAKKVNNSDTFWGW
jgi:hypothetical protein